MQDWGRRTLSAGNHIFRLECKGKSEKSQGYFLGLDLLDVPMRAYERPPGFDLRKIQVPTSSN